jgi:hypothetical protein
MSCCRKGPSEIYAALKAAGLHNEAATFRKLVKSGKIEFEKVTIGHVVVAVPKGMPKECQKVYLKCRASPKGKSGSAAAKEYCARSAWQVCCKSIAPDHAGCTEYGKTSKTKSPKSGA